MCQWEKLKILAKSTLYYMKNKKNHFYVPWKTNKISNINVTYTHEREKQSRMIYKFKNIEGNKGCKNSKR